MDLIHNFVLPQLFIKAYMHWHFYCFLYSSSPYKPTLVSHYSFKLSSQLVKCYPCLWKVLRRCGVAAISIKLCNRWGCPSLMNLVWESDSVDKQPQLVLRLDAGQGERRIIRHRLRIIHHSHQLPFTTVRFSRLFCLSVCLNPKMA